MKTEITLYPISEDWGESTQERELERVIEFAKEYNAEVIGRLPIVLLVMVVELSYQPKKGEYIVHPYNGVCEVEAAYTDIMTNTYQITVTP